ncbi:carboxypeptidase-like regulatory domain-containing protein [Flavobacterium sp.]|uniref:carboxypeptidase-like regulatory domain-containing protein n=1 Tax=Flavobacterium sp. TaxID=239 RepID=UPI002FDEDB62
MAKQLLLFLIFCPLVVLSQNDSIVNGKVVSESSLLEGIHVINLSKQNGAVTDSRGYFKIKAKVSDTLQFSAINLKATRYVLKESDFSNDLLLIKMESLITELKEIAIINYKNINAVALGIIPANQKSYTPAERKLAAAGDFKWYSPLLIPLGGMSVDGLINSISGRTTMLKKELVVERKEMLQAETLDYFERKYFVETLKIPDEYVDGFLFYIVENEKFVNAMKDKNKTMASFVLSELAVEYLRLNELQPSTSVKNEK